MAEGVAGIARVWFMRFHSYKVSSVINPLASEEEIKAQDDLVVTLPVSHSQARFGPKQFIPFSQLLYWTASWEGKRLRVLVFYLTDLVHLPMAGFTCLCS